MKLVFDEGVVSGTYKSTTIVPDMFYGQHITLIGTTGTHDKSIKIEFKMIDGKFNLDGAFHGDNISGTAHDQKNSAFDFLAQRLHK